jgi:hypothetical protein
MSKKHVFKTPNSEYVNGNRDSNFQRNYKKCMKVIGLMRTIDYVLNAAKVVESNKETKKNIINLM